MLRPGVGWLLASVCCSSIAHLSLKLAARLLPASISLPQVLAAAVFNPWLIAGIALHVIALGLWVLGLRSVDLSVAYPFIALGLVFVTLLSWAFLHETVGAIQAVGIALIAAGVITVAMR